jgi:hypothetical protein
MMPSPDTKKLAEKIATILESEPHGGELASLFASIEKINHRLDKLEGSDPLAPHSALRSPPLPHPSLDKFNVAEAIADSIFSHYKKEKACQFEPGKPCDHCSMCNSRGF